MKVSQAIALLSEEDPDAQIMIQWFTKEHVEGNLNVQLTDFHWEAGVSSFDESSVSMDAFEVEWCLDDAENNMVDSE
jgi:hypothetical protein